MSSNIFLLLKLTHLFKVESKAAYQSPFPDLAKVGVLCIRYDYFNILDLHLLIIFNILFGVLDRFEKEKLEYTRRLLGW